MIDKTVYNQIVENTFVKHAYTGQIVQSIMFGGDTSGELYRVTELQDKPYKTRVMSLLFEDEEKVIKHGLTPRAHYLDNELPCRIYVEHNK
jgi:hypothetical protein